MRVSTLLAPSYGRHAQQAGNEKHRLLLSKWWEILRLQPTMASLKLSSFEIWPSLACGLILYIVIHRHRNQIETQYKYNALHVAEKTTAGAKHICLLLADKRKQNEFFKNRVFKLLDLNISKWNILPFLDGQERKKEGKQKRIDVVHHRWKAVQRDCAFRVWPLVYETKMTLWWWLKTVSLETRSISQGGRHRHSYWPTVLGSGALSTRRTGWRARRSRKYKPTSWMQGYSSIDFRSPLYWMSTRSMNSFSFVSSTGQRIIDSSFIRPLPNQLQFQLYSAKILEK